MKVEHDADHGKPGFTHPLQERLDTILGVAVDHIDDSDLGVVALADRAVDMVEMIASSPLKGAGQPIHADPYEVGRRVESERTVGVDVHVEKADPLKVRLTLLEDNEEYTAGTHIIEIKNVEDRYTDQLTELAKVINGEIKNPYSYEHELLVQEVLLAASGYTIWES